MGAMLTLQGSPSGSSLPVCKNVVDSLTFAGYIHISYLAKEQNKPMNTVYKALSDPTRRKILELLRDGDLTAGELADHFDLAKPTLSKHFAVLKEADLIDGDKNGTTITYHLNVTVLEEALMALMSVFRIEGADAILQDSDDEPHEQRNTKGGGNDD